MLINVVHLITGLNTGGAEMSLYRLLSRMDRTRFENRVISMIPIGPVGEMIQALGIPVDSLGMKPGRFSLGALKQLVQRLRSESPHILQTWLYHADLMGLIAAKLSATPRVAWNIRSSDMDISQFHRPLGLVIKACAALSQYPQVVVVNSIAGRQVHSKLGYHPRQWVLIHNGLDPDEYQMSVEVRRVVRKELALDPGTTVIGMAARYNPKKAHALFIRAAGLLSRTGIPVHFLMVGEGVTAENTSLVNLLNQESLEKNVHLLGRRDDMPRLYASMDILTSPSIFGEGFPNVIAEGMVTGIPCVVTDVGDSALLVGNTGKVVHAGDPEALVSAWQELISIGEKQRNELGKAARQRVIEYFSIGKAVDAYENLYKTLVGSTT